MSEQNERTWEDHWKEQDVPWDAGASPPALSSLLREHRLEQLLGRPLTRARALVPGCGSGYDVLSLAEAGAQAVGLDMAPSARPRFEKLRAERGLAEGQARLETADFFSWEPPGQFEVVWDYTFYCAIRPDQRDAWCERMVQMLAPGGVLAMLIFPVSGEPPNKKTGPPFPLDPEEVKRRLKPHFISESVEPVVRSHPGREGKEWLGLWKAARQGFQL